jgi:hypothetical protein
VKPIGSMHIHDAEANAIATELSGSPDKRRRKMGELLRTYLNRELLYSVGDERQLKRIDVDTVNRQRQLWSTVRAATAAQPTPIIALVVDGMNDVLNSQGYTEAAWLNRIPVAA